jgi:hypothetical protein
LTYRSRLTLKLGHERLFELLSLIFFTFFESLDESENFVLFVGDGLLLEILFCVRIPLLLLEGVGDMLCGVNSFDEDGLLLF